MAGCMLAQLSGQDSAVDNKKPAHPTRHLEILLYGGGQWFNPLDGDSATPVIAVPLINDKPSRARVATFNFAELENNPIAKESNYPPKALMERCAPSDACTLEATLYGVYAKDEIPVKLDFVYPTFEGFIEYALDRPGLPTFSYYAFHGKRPIQGGKPVLLGSLYNLAQSANAETQIFAHITGEEAPATTEETHTYKLTASWQGDDSKEKHAIAVVLSPGSSARIELQQIIPFYKTEAPSQTPSIALPKTPIALSATMSDIEKSGYMTIQFQWDDTQLENMESGTPRFTMRTCKGALAFSTENADASFPKIVCNTDFSLTSSNSKVSSKLKTGWTMRETKPFQFTAALLAGEKILPLPPELNAKANTHLTLKVEPWKDTLSR